MDTYLLLRNNKQSGPYSLQQLVNAGLKPYDLVWVEGKSAAWRYPSEVEGLKAYAPATEEQPFDRFYKKPEEKPVSKPVQQKEEIRLQPKEEVYSHPTEEEYSLPTENTTLTTKKIFVSMPGGQATKRPVATAQPKAPVLIEEKPVLVEEKKIESKPRLVHEEPVLKQSPILPKQEPVFKESTVSIKEEPALNEKYSESLDDIKKRYTETYFNRKKKSKWTSTHTSLVQVFGGAIFFCFLVVVAYKNFSGEEKTQSKTTVIQPDRRSINTSTTITTPATTLPVVAETVKQPETKTSSQKTVIDPPSESLSTNTTQQKTDDLKKESQTAAAEYKPLKKAEVIDDVKTGEVKPKTRPVNIHKLVNVKANNYKQRAFGGVMNLQLTVNNDSKFELDKVIVELQYLKPSEEPIKTEKIVFSSIAPNDSKTLKIPDYLRGVKVSYRVIDVESSQYER
jgi:hypothetical protein